MVQQKFNVAMSCGGCSKAVQTILSKTPGVTIVEISLEKQLVTVESDLPSNDILAAIKKTGKTCSVNSS